MVLFMPTFSNPTPRGQSFIYELPGIQNGVSIKLLSVDVACTPPPPPEGYFATHTQRTHATNE